MQPGRLVGPLIKGLTALCVAYVALWACAPPAAMPPPVPMGAASAEWGVAGVGGVNVAPATRDSAQVHPYGTGMAWGRWEWGKGRSAWQAGPVGWFGAAPPVDVAVEGGVGGYIRQLHPLAGGVMHLGWQVEGGWLYGAIGVPLSVNLSDRVAVYTLPSLGYRLSGFDRVPVGVVLPVGHGALQAEVGVSGLTPYSYDGSQVYGSLGYSRRY